MIKINSVGTTKAKIMLIGEWPNDEERKTAIPFVGASGRLLDTCLSHAGIERDNCYLTFNKFKDLDIEIDLVRPNVIVPLGNVGLKSVCGSGYDDVPNFRGSVLNSRMIAGVTYKVIPTVAPNTCFKDWLNVHYIVADLKKIKAESAFSGFKFMQRDFVASTDFTTCLDGLKRLSKAEYLSVDLETFKKNPVIRCVGLGDSADYALCVPMLNKLDPVWTPPQELELWTWIVKLLTDDSIKKIAHHAKFELTQLFPYTGRNMTVWMDTMRAYALLYPEFKHGLAKLISLYTDIAYYKEDAKGHDLRVDDNQLWLYNCKDVAGTFESAMAIEEELKVAGMHRFYHFYDNPLMMALWDLEMRGIKIDTTATSAINEALTTGIEEKRAGLVKALGSPIAVAAKEEGLNVNSSKQMCEYLYDELGLPVQYNKDKDGKQTPTADGKALKVLARRFGKKAFYDIVNIKSLVKLRSTYANIKLADDGRMHTSYGLTKSGRLSSKKDMYKCGMNLQNIPKTKDAGYKIRSMFVADPGKILIAADKWQAEAMVVAWEARETKMKEWLAGGNKVHTLVAQEIFECDEPTKPQYNMAKRVVHGTNYKMGIYTLAETCETTVARARKAQDMYFKKFPSIQAWQQEVVTDTKKTKTLYTALGRRRVFANKWDHNLEREIVSFLPQGTVADDINFALLKLNFALPDQAEILMQVHDELIIQCWPDQKDEVIRLLKLHGEVPMVCGGDVLTIPLDIKVGENWFDMEEV